MKKLVKAKRATEYNFRSFLDTIDQDRYCNIEDFPGQCGMSIIRALCSVSPYVQLACIRSAFHRRSQVVFTDVLSMERVRWKEAKSVAVRGPITINPNTKRKICIYVITEKELKLLFSMLYSLWVAAGCPDEWDNYGNCFLYDQSDYPSD